MIAITESEADAVSSTTDTPFVKSKVMSATVQKTEMTRRRTVLREPSETDEMDTSQPEATGRETTGSLVLNSLSTSQRSKKEIVAASIDSATLITPQRTPDADKVEDDVPMNRVAPRRTRSPTKKSVPSNTTRGGDSSIIEELKNRFQELSILRTTAAEALLAEYKSAAEARIEAAEKVIDAFRKENELLKQQQQRPIHHDGDLSDRRRISDVSTISRGS